MKNLLTLIVFILFIGCKDKTGKTNESKDSKDSIYKETVIKSADDEDDETVEEFKETFIDSLTIAAKGKYKIEITQNSTDTITKVSIALFQKQNQRWKNIQNYILNKESDIPMLPEIEDFNNDGLNDFTIHYAVAARGSNDIRKLFIFSKKENKFIEIKNSDNYPNLNYNKNLNCIDALSVYGGSTTTFLKLTKDSLTEFAKVNFMDGDVESFIIRGNKEIKLYSGKYQGSNDYLVRFSNYNPIEE
ncbi:XAC2610-related protein [Flavobacterium procerum]|uniref:XAC2610-related protein n=1 Tax=Flavobacterium procerum TaxID=1455569 RepID=A0ABV6BXF6_9FLAO